MNEAKARLDELEQKMARGSGHSLEQKSLGQQFVEGDAFKEASDPSNPRFWADLHIKADITSATSGDGSFGAAIEPNRLAGIQPLPRRQLTVRDLLSPGRTNSPQIEYIQETGFNNMAAPVKEGDLKPQSDIKVASKSTSTKVIAHWMAATRQILSDAPQLRSFIDERLLYGLKHTEEQQLLNGDGTGENLHGIIPQATSYAVPPGLTVATPTGIDVLRIAMLQAALAEYPATGIVLNPINWAAIEMLKDGDGRYLIGNPQGTLSPTIWGLPVVTTQAMQVSKFLAGAFKLGAQIFDQWQSRVGVGFQNDDYTRNKVTILAEERLALAIYRPEAFIYGNIA